MNQNLDELNATGRIDDLRRLIQRKPALKSLYLETYAKYQECLKLCPADGLVIELGSGGGFIKEILPEVCTTDVLPYPGLDQVVDATQMPFPTGSLRAILMQNVFHHIPDIDAFLKEAERCLKPGGRIFIADQHCGWISRYVLKYLHHEPFNPKSSRWGFDSDGPLSGANGALTWIVFKRDLKLFQKRFPGFQFQGYFPHTPLRYWLCGGLKNWNLIPNHFLFKAFTVFDRLLIKISKNFGSFVYVELEKTSQSHS